MNDPWPPRVDPNVDPNVDHQQSPTNYLAEKNVPFWALASETDVDEDFVVEEEKTFPYDAPESALSAEPGVSWISVPTEPTDFSGEPNTPTVDNFFDESEPVDEFGEFYNVDATTIASHTIFPAPTFKNLFLPGITVSGLFVVAVLCLFTSPVASIAALLFLALPLWEIVGLIPWLSRIEISEKEFTRIRPLGNTSMRWQECELMTLDVERGLYGRRKKLTNLMLIPKDEKQKKIVVSLRPYVGKGPDGWGINLVSAALLANVFVDETTQNILVQFGTKPAKRKRRREKNKEEEA